MKDKTEPRILHSDKTEPRILHNDKTEPRILHSAKTEPRTYFYHVERVDKISPGFYISAM